jgi:hypothetical protein
MIALQPVSAALEAEVRQRVRQHGVVVWLDRDSTYSQFVDQLKDLSSEGLLPYAVRAFRGSHLALLLELDGMAAGADAPPLLIHLPGFTEESVKSTPIFSFYKAGIRYRKGLDTLITEASAGQVPPDRIQAFLEAGDLSLEAADQWMRRQVTGTKDNLETLLAAMAPAALLDDLLTGGPITVQIKTSADSAKLLGVMAAACGLPAGWQQHTLDPSSPSQSSDDLSFLITSWALCVEYVHDLKRPPVSSMLQCAPGLPAGVIESCRQLATHLRERHTAFYERTADSTEALMGDEVQAARAEDLGKIDTFRFEEDKVLQAALEALGAQQFDQAATWAAQRLPRGNGKAMTARNTFWLERDPSRESTWQLIAAAAHLGQALQAVGSLSAAHSLEEATAAYQERGARVDQAHRQLEQRRLVLLYPSLPQFDRLRQQLDGLRLLWRQWADEWARAFNRLCRTHGFLPGPGLQQRNLFDEVVRPFTTERGTTALFMVDALRYEMAAQLFDELAETPASTVQLKARLAELPTVTEVGMNVLAPVSSHGKLSPALSSPDGGIIQGFGTGEYRVFDPKTRQRAMQERVGGATCPKLTLAEVINSSSSSLKRSITQAKLVIVHSQEIDDAGEKGVGLDVFDRVLQGLRAAWHLLREAGVKRFVITADHGFLLNEGPAPAALSHGRKIDPHRRHVFSSVAADHTGEVRVPLVDLGYQGVDAQLMLPETTAVFDTGQKSMRFVHGGNSLQERVIPVLTLVHQALAGSSTQHFTLQVTALDDVGDMHCLGIQATADAQLALEFSSTRLLELALHAPDHPDLQVEICQVRGAASHSGGTIQATVGESFELFFRLSGAVDERVRVEVFHPSALADVSPCIPIGRFAVSAVTAAAVAATRPSPAVGSYLPWLSDLSDNDGIRRLFTHLAAHGAITETEAAAMLGGPRAVRRFAGQFDALAQKAPFDIRIDVVGGVKRYVREQG